MIWNVVDFAFILSLPVTTLLLARLPTLLKKSYFAVRWRRPAASLSVFVMLDLAEISHGEVSRIWAYVGPLFVWQALAPIKAT